MSLALPTPDRPIRIGTRASPLAVAQADLAVAALNQAYDLIPGSLIKVPMTASGDKVQDRSLADLGGKALWTRELDVALDGGAIDLAVHSLKDVETLRPMRFTLGAMLERADPRDRLIVRNELGISSIAALPPGARFGTSSPRRAAQLLRRRPDLDIRLLRGNVARRLEQVRAGEVDATLLAAAGLDRLGMQDIGHIQPISLLLPAASQGAIGIECRSDDSRMIALLAAVCHAPTRRAVSAERAFLAALGGDCRSPVAAHAYYQSDGILRLDAELFSEDGGQYVAGDIIVDDPDDADAAAALARHLLAEAPATVRRLFGGA